MSRRTGLPITVAAVVAAKLPGKAQKTRSATFASQRLVKPATAFCSCTSSVRPSAAAIRPPGPAANPPKPTTTSGRNRSINANADQSERPSFQGASSRLVQRLPLKPEIGSVCSEMAARGTNVASMPREVPSQDTWQPRSRRTAASASPGNTWPPVPPAMMRICGGRAFMTPGPGSWAQEPAPPIARGRAVPWPPGSRSANCRRN